MRAFMSNFVMDSIYVPFQSLRREKRFTTQLTSMYLDFVSIESPSCRIGFFAFFALIPSTFCMDRFYMNLHGGFPIHFPTEVTRILGMHFMKLIVNVKRRRGCESFTTILNHANKACCFVNNFPVFSIVMVN